MRLVVLSDNRANNDYLEAEHGLCFYLETNNHRYLLDTGGSDLFIRNAEKLDIDLQRVDYVFISHAHADHTGGLASFLSINQTAKVILSAKINGRRFFSSRLGRKKDISMPFDLTPWFDRCLFVEDKLDLNDEARFYTTSKTFYPLPAANQTLFTEVEGRLVPDTFSHELVACFGKENLFVFTGCAHKGLQNMLEEVVIQTGIIPTWVAGGFHLLDSNPIQKFETSEYLDNLARVLVTSFPDTVFFTGHCTGNLVYERLNSLMGNKIHQFYTGLILRFEMPRAEITRPEADEQAI